METFFRGILLKNEKGASSGEIVYDRWLEISVAPATSVPIFDREILSTHLTIGTSYEFVLLVAVPSLVQIASHIQSEQDLEVIARKTIVIIDAQAGIATPLERKIRNYPIRGIVRDLAWSAFPGDYLHVAPELSTESFLLLETAFGFVLMHQASLEEQERENVGIGDTLTWDASRLDLLGVRPAVSTDLPKRPLKILLDEDTDIIERMTGQSFQNILREGGETWNRWQRAVTLKGIINLRNADLRNAQLSGVRLSLASLTGTELSGAHLDNAYLWRTTLMAATLDRATLRQTHLGCAHLDGASLIGADLTEANLEDASLSNADLSGAILTGARVRGINLFEANGLESVIADWIDIGEEESPELLEGNVAQRWLMERATGEDRSS